MNYKELADALQQKGADMTNDDLRRASRALEVATLGLDRNAAADYTRLAAGLREMADAEPVGYWGGEFTKDGGADLYEVPQESCFGRVYKNLPLYAAPVAAQPQDSEPLSDAEMPLTGGGNVYMSQFDFNVLQRRGRVTATLYNEPVGNAITEVRLIAHGIKERG